jgi:hypothetical protein
MPVQTDQIKALDLAVVSPDAQAQTQTAQIAVHSRIQVEALPRLRIGSPPE